MDHGPAVKLGVDHAQKKKQRLGVWLFFVYTIVYAIYVTIIVMDVEIMGTVVMGNQTLAIVYGFGLIIFAVVLGLIYNWICTRYENKMNKEEKQ
jgi:uncharacterized membrane protein (DUF485 family)